MKEVDTVISNADNSGASKQASKQASKLRSINAEEEPIMIEMTSTKNTIITSGISATLTARMGTGGNQVSVVLVKDLSC